MSEFVTYPGVSIWGSKDDVNAMMKDVYQRGFASGAAAQQATTDKLATMLDRLLDYSAHDLSCLKPECGPCMCGLDEFRQEVSTAIDAILAAPLAEPGAGGQERGE